MKYFKDFKKVLQNFSKAIYVNIRTNHTLLIEARRNCTHLDNETRLFHLISFFDYCDKISAINSDPPHGIIFLQGFCDTLLKMRNKMILSQTNDHLGLSIFFPPDLEMLSDFNINNKEIIDLPVEIDDVPVPYTPYLWECNVIKLLERDQQH